MWLKLSIWVLTLLGAVVSLWLGSRHWMWLLAGLILIEAGWWFQRQRGQQWR